VGSVFIGRDALPGRLTNAGRNRGGRFQFTVNGDVGANLEVQSSTNLVDWVGMTNYLNQGGSFLFDDPGSTNHPMRFYRAWPKDN
jgi:hypothetical protein